MNRRTFLKLALTASGGVAAVPWLQDSLSGCNLSDTPNPTISSLRESAARKGIVFGSAVRGRQLLADLPFAQLFRQQCGILVPELELKWDALRPTPEQFDFNGADWLAEFAKSRGMLFRGHTLVWEGALPPWFNRVVNEQNAVRIMTDHVSKVVGHFSGKVDSWDVVNEGVQIQDGRRDGLKVTPWLRFAGAEYIGTAFQAAHAADPSARLVYNENFLETDDQLADKKRVAVLSLLRTLKKENVPVHALGIQGHLYAEANTTGPNFERFLQDVSDLGLTILITELDVRDIHLAGTIEQRDRIIAGQYFKFLSFMMKFPALKTILTWGLTDRYTWLSRSYPRPDGFAVRPLPYDAELRPTPSWEAILKAFDEAPNR